ncbi:MAG: ATP-binding protein [Bacteroidota bacterium]
MSDLSSVKTFLKSLTTLSNVEDEALDWLLSKARITSFPADTFLFEPGDDVEDLIIVLEGEVNVYFESEEGRQPLFLQQKGSIAGNLPFSRVKKATAFGKIITPTTLLLLSKNYFTEMVTVSYSMTQALVAVMSDRIRDVSQNRFQDEKLKALGKISAGLAHELNNPASAMVRSAEILYEKLSETPENFKAVMQLAVSAEQTDNVNELIFEKISTQKTAPKDFSLLERQDRVDELMDWMEDHAVENADMIAETLTDFNFETSDLETLLTIVQAEHKLSPVLNWFDNRLSVELLVSEIKEASSRVANLVQSVKKYSHMDEGRSKRMTDIHDGLRTTLSILDHQMKQKQIKIDKDFADTLPTIEANAGELNQIWTNLLANAIDAAPRKGGVIKVRTFMDCDYVCVAIEDNGSGIPEDILSRIWEPFFTTKGVGEGTGMGLDMVKKIVTRHRGYIGVVSNPGKTVFNVKFLVKQQ